MIANIKILIMFFMAIGGFVTVPPLAYCSTVTPLKTVTMETQNEVWKDIPGYEGLYQVSNLGGVKSLKRKDTKWRKLLERIMTPYKDTAGYYTISLRKKGNYYKHNLHRLLALAFIPNYSEKATVNHINGIKTDNRLENLEWATYSENNQHAYDTGLKIGASIGKIGKLSPSSKRVKQIDIETNKIINVFDSVHDVFRKFGFQVGNVAACARGETKTAYGFNWEYHV